jgi:ribonuclease HI
MKDWSYVGYFDGVDMMHDGISGIGFMILNPYDQVIHVDSFVLPQTGTNEAEFLALLWLVKRMGDMHIPMVKLYGDNTVVIDGVKNPKKYSCYRVYERAIRHHLTQFKKWELYYIESGRNRADDLSRALIRGWITQPIGERHIDLIMRLSEKGNGHAFGRGISKWPAQKYMTNPVLSDGDLTIDHRSAIFKPLRKKEDNFADLRVHMPKM